MADDRNRSKNESDFRPVSRGDFGDRAGYSGRAGTKIDPYSATMKYGAPWNGGEKSGELIGGSGINDPRPQDPRVAADALSNRAQSIMEATPQYRGGGTDSR